MMLGVVPSYGRDYKSKAAAQADWDENLDFTCSAITEGGRQINKKDATSDGSGITGIMLRYGNLRKQCQLKIGKAADLV